ncbi:MAG: hypothetical protein IJR87_00800 [Bacteroidaceae bacterium]|nr:hypothetical protein [Bacteroidaceae bacterium]
MKIRFVSYILLIILYGSCTGRKEQTVTVESLEGCPVAVDSSYYGSKALLLCNGLLFTWPDSPSETCCVGVLTRDSLTNYQGGFRRGHGHNEFQNIALARGKDSSVYIAACPSTCNQILSMIRTGKAESIEAIKDVEAWTKYDLTGLPLFRCISDVFLSLSDSTFMILGAPYDDIEHLMTIIDFKSQRLIPLDYWPEDDSPCNGHAKHGVYTDNSIILWNDKDRFLYVCGEGNFAFVFSIEGNSIKVIKELYSIRPQYEYMGDDNIGRMNYIIKNRPVRRLRPDANDDHIYVFLKEKDKDGNKTDNRRNSVCGNMIEVYDWDGNLEKTIKLDNYGKYIKVTEDDKLLYLFSEDWETGEPQIWVYDL